ncbi:AAA family ATPase [Halorussus salinus]|uniref:AAA family ATPase n=1 Tax=Halorussus salinus TaxID=1364935 RepID=UPI0010921A0E|nr:MoxR family ATPase [Halorussus salinus]
MTEPAAIYEDLRDRVGTVLVGNEEIVEGLTISLLTRGHVLLEGVPGVAKTTIALLFAEATGMDSNRIQMTPDILPADITGTNVYREATGEFDLQRGPVFTNLVVADEINRATPKTQSALLEAMQESAVTIEGETLSLPEPFLVVATQNPVEMEGTYELPIAQRDRFQFKFTVGMPDADDEMALLDRFDQSPDLGPGDVSPVVSTADILDARETVEEVHVERAVKEYLLGLVGATRESPDLEYGASPRTALSFLHATKARAAIRGRDYVIPDDAKALAEPLLAHRLTLSAEAELGDVTVEDVVADVLASVEPPSGPEDPTESGASESDVSESDAAAGGS